MRSVAVVLGVRVNSPSEKYQSQCNFWMQAVVVAATGCSWVKLQTRVWNSDGYMSDAMPQRLIEHLVALKPILVNRVKLFSLVR